MSNPARMIQVGDHTAEPVEPSFFTGSGFAIGEIELGLNVLARKVRDLKRGNEAGSAVDQKLAAEAIAKTAEQIQMLANVVARVTISHLNRTGKVRC